METVKCIICKREFMKKAYNHKCCNKECARINKNSESKKRYGNNSHLAKDYYHKNKITINERRRNRYKYDIFYWYCINLRTRTRKFLRQKSCKNSEIYKLIGCTPNFLRLYIEKKFTPEMTWDNYGVYWELDHLYSFKNAKNRTDLVRICHHSNIRPLEISSNRSKG